MGYHLSRQRDFNDNCLYLEIASGGPKKAGPDVLTIRYPGEGKNLVDPRDAINNAAAIYKLWERDYGDETKRLRVVGEAKPLVYDCTPKGFAAAKLWADKAFANMAKCGSCSKAMGNKDPYEHEDLTNAVFCNEQCLATKYRAMFGIEVPRVASNKEKKSTKK